MGQTIWWIFLEKIFFFGSWLERLLTFGQKHYRNVVKTNFYLLRKPVDEIYFFEFSNVFGTYSDFGRKCFWLLANKSSRKVFKLLLFAFRVHLDENYLFFWKNLSGLTSELRPKLFLTIGKIFAEKLSKLFSTCSGNKLKKQIFHKFFGFYVYFDFKRNFFWLLEFSLRKFVKTAFYEFRRTLWSEKLLRKFPILLRRFVIKTFSDFSQKMYIKFAKTNFCVFRKYFEEPEFSEKFTSCLVHTRILSIISTDFWDKSFLKVFKTASYTFRRTIWWKTILLLQFFELWSKQFFLTDDIFFFLLQKCQNWFLRLQGSILIKKLFWKTLPRFFRTMSNSLPDFRQKLHREVVQTVLYVFRKYFHDANFFNCFVFGANLDFELFFDMRHKFFCKVVKTAFSMFRRTLWWKAFLRKILQLIFGLWAKRFLNLGENFTEK